MPSSSSCATEFEDVASKVILADTVVLATAHRIRRLGGGASADSRTQTSAVRFRVEHVFKGNIPEMAQTVPPPTAVTTSDVIIQKRRSGDSAVPLTTLTVMTFGHRADVKACVAPEVTLGKRYLVFLHARLASAGDSTDATYYISGFPVNATDSNVAEVRRLVRCTKCTRRPRATMSPTQRTLKAGQKLKLSCRTSGKPQPIVTWFKDGFPLLLDRRRMNIKTSKRSSQLSIGRTTPIDSGLYECQASNVVARTQKMAANVVVSPPDAPTEKAFTDLCERQDYCFNGGICRIMKSLGKQFCECPAEFEGLRCQEKTNGLAGLSKKRRRWIITPLQQQLELVEQQQKQRRRSHRPSAAMTLPEIDEGNHSHHLLRS
jgi:hypothetical protein